MIDRVRLRSNQWRKLRSIVLNLATTDSFYGKKIREWELKVSRLNRIDDFIAQVPFTSKADIQADRAENPPFGTNLTRAIHQYTRFCQTSGTRSSQAASALRSVARLKRSSMVVSPRVGSSHAR